jgi:hypothetical protein
MLFQNFLTNTEEERNRLSDLTDLWDNVPRYSISRQAMTEIRIDGEFLRHHVAEFQYLGKAFRRTLYPARVEDLDGKHRDFYASANEELVEHALRKLAVDQQAGYFDKTNYRSGVVFSLSQLREELQKRGHTRSYPQIVLALNILSQSAIDIVSMVKFQQRYQMRNRILSKAVPAWEFCSFCDSQKCLPLVRQFWGFDSHRILQLFV